jgi:hypothetical protein
MTIILLGCIVWLSLALSMAATAGESGVSFGVSVDHVNNMASNDTQTEDNDEPRYSIKVLAHTRPVSLRRLLDSLDAAQYDGNEVHADIWIDAPRTEDEAKLHERVVDIAQSWEWKHGAVKIHKRSEWVGLRRQWLDCYQPIHDNDTALILEDDMEVSTFFWQWLQQARAFAAQEQRGDAIAVAGISLMRQQYVNMKPTKKIAVIDSPEQLYWYRMAGMWGFSPQPQTWSMFLRWYESHANDEETPSLEGSFFAQALASGTPASMWTQHFIRFCISAPRPLYTLYANLENGRTFAANWREKGEHFNVSLGQDFELAVEHHTFHGPAFPKHPLAKLDWTAGVENPSSLTSVQLVDWMSTSKADVCINGYCNNDLGTSAADECISGYCDLNSHTVKLAHLATQQTHTSVQQVLAEHWLWAAVGVTLSILCVGMRPMLPIVGTVVLSAVCELAAPFARREQNTDLFCMILLILAPIACIWTRKAKPGVLSRAQTNEWKGGMQVMIVLYHYCNQGYLFVIMRVLVSAYVFLSGFGNGFYFFHSENPQFTAKRGLAVLWRLCSLSALLSYCTSTPWVLYYVVMLHALHFIMMFCCVKLSSIFVTEKASQVRVSLASYAVLIVAGWELGNHSLALLFSAGVLKPWLGNLAHSIFWYRTKMDAWSSFIGLAFAAGFPYLKELCWPKSRSKHKVTVLVIACVFVFCWLCLALFHPEYSTIHRLVGTLPIPLYLVLRNWNNECQQAISVPLEFLGTYSLELYLLQFHILLTHQAQELLVLVDGMPLVNFVVVASMYVFASSIVGKATCEFGKQIFTRWKTHPSTTKKDNWQFSTFAHAICIIIIVACCIATHNGAETIGAKFQSMAPCNLDDMVNVTQHEYPQAAESVPWNIFGPKDSCGCFSERNISKVVFIGDSHSRHFYSGLLDVFEGNSGLNQLPSMDMSVPAEHQDR